MDNSLAHLSNRPRKKTVQIVFLLIFLAALALGVIHIIDTHSDYTRRLQAQAIQLASSACALIPPDQIALFDADASDAEKPAYQMIKNSLTRFKQQNDDVRFAYLYTEMDGEIYLLVDSESPESQHYSLPGQHFSEAASSYWQPLENNQPFLSEPTTDRWGTWVSALVPIKDQNGSVGAVFGLDYSATDWAQEIQEHVIQAIQIVLLGLLFLAIVYILILKNDKLRYLSGKLQMSESLFRTVFEQAPIGIAIGENDRLVSSINPAFASILARSKEELTGINWAEITHPDDLQTDIEQFNRFKKGEIESYSMPKRFVKPDGSDAWVNMTVAPLLLKDGPDSNDHHLCIIQDISQRISAEKAFSESERSKTVLLSHLQGMAYRCNFDRDWTMQFVSEGCFELTGYHPESLLNNKDLTYNDIIVREYRERLWREWQRVLSLRQPFRGEYEIITAAKERKWVLELGQGIYDSQGNIEAIEGIIVDITEQKKREAQILYMNNHDFMTGLYNRRYFEEATRFLDIEKNLPLCVIIADINGLRLINDTLGHAEGDRIIIEVAKIVQSSCKETDVPARTGGDEFSILLPATDWDQAYDQLIAIKQTCERKSLTLTKKTQHISISIGLGIKKAKTESLTDAIKEAEEYMHKSKLLERKSYHSAVLSSVMATMYARSQETEAHAERLAELCKMIGEKLDLSQKSLDELELLSMLHDIGKVGIDDYILNKPAKLTDEEWRIMKKHSEIGCRIAAATPELESIAEPILSHHERWDGTGYPGKLKGEDIPLLSRILAVADAYDAMTQDRVYRKALPVNEALEEIRRNAGTQFDPHIARLFIENAIHAKKAKA